MKNARLSYGSDGHLCYGDICFWGWSKGAEGLFSSRNRLFDVGIAVSAGDEVRFKGRRSQVNAVIQHRQKVALEGLGVAAFGIGVVRDRPVAEKTLNMVPAWGT